MHRSNYQGLGPSAERLLKQTSELALPEIRRFEFQDVNQQDQSVSFVIRAHACTGREAGGPRGR